MLYTEYQYIKPPRAEQKIPAHLLKLFEAQGWWIQYKKNGTNSVIYVTPQKNVFAKTRHQDKPDHKMWVFSDASEAIFQKVSGNGWWVFNAELLHSKTPHIKDTNYLHDVLVADGEYLLDMPYAERYDILLATFPTIGETRSHFVLNENTWIARNREHDFGDEWNLLLEQDKSEDEGFVLKHPGRKIKESWTMKVRKPHKNYTF